MEAQIASNDAVTRAFKSWLEPGVAPGLQRVAAELLGTAEGEERLPWDPPLVERVERILMALDEPCRCDLVALESLANAREVRRGLRLENALQDTLRGLVDQIQLAFIFGSTARQRQREDSDIDLLIIGQVRLKDLSTPLRDAERRLGRRVTPALYTPAAFQEKYQSGDPFLTDVYRREKIPVLPLGMSRKDLDDELRAMVAERVAATG